MRTPPATANGTSQPALPLSVREGGCGTWWGNGRGHQQHRQTERRWLPTTKQRCGGVWPPRGTCQSPIPILIPQGPARAPSPPCRFPARSTSIPTLQDPVGSRPSPPCRDLAQRLLHPTWLHRHPRRHPQAPRGTPR